MLYHAGLGAFDGGFVGVDVFFVVCPVVGDLLVYRDDSHLPTAYPAWLTPLVTARLAGDGGAT